MDESETEAALEEHTYTEAIKGRFAFATLEQLSQLRAQYDALEKKFDQLYVWIAGSVGSDGQQVPGLISRLSSMEQATRASTEQTRKNREAFVRIGRWVLGIVITDTVTRLLNIHITP